MNRWIATLAVAGAAAATLNAQDVKSTTTVKAEDGRTVVYAGCVQPGTEGTSYVLNNAVPMKQTKTETKIGKSGLPETTTTTTTSYMLVPADKMDFASNVGHRVEVTAIEIPRGDNRTTIETKTKTEIKGQPTQETQIKEKVPQRDMPQLRVVSVKHLTERCQ